MTIATRSDYLTRPYEPSDLPQVLELMRASLGETETLRRTPAFWEWKHVSNPFGASRVRVAVANDGTLTGLRSFMRWQFSFGDRLIEAARPVDTATHPDYQRRGIFARLTTEAVADAQQNGIGVLFNTPNPRSMAGYLKMGWQTIGNAQPLVRVLNWPRFASGLIRTSVPRLPISKNPPQASLKRSNALEPASALRDIAGLDELISRDHVLWANTLRTVRSRGHLVWRFAQHPTICYHLVAIDGHDGLEALAVIRLGSRYGAREAVLSELLVRNPDQRIVAKTIQQIVASVDADYLITYFPTSSFHHAALRSTGFRPLPRKRIAVVANSIAPSVSMPAFDEWGMALSDLEVF